MYFNYVLDVPVFGSAARSGQLSVREFRSNEVEAAIDCTRGTISILKVIAYSGSAASGAVVGGHQPTYAESAPTRIDTRAGSTHGYLYRILCSGNARQ